MNVLSARATRIVKSTLRKPGWAISLIGFLIFFLRPRPRRCRKRQRTLLSWVHRAGRSACCIPGGQALNYHPHIHALVPAGGLDADGQQWICASKDFFVPIKALSKIYRAVCFELLTKALVKNDLIIPKKDEAIYQTSNCLPI